MLAVTEKRFRLHIAFVVECENLLEGFHRREVAIIADRDIDLSARHVGSFSAAKAALQPVRRRLAIGIDERENEPARLRDGGVARGGGAALAHMQTHHVVAADRAHRLDPARGIVVGDHDLDVAGRQRLRLEQGADTCANSQGR